MHINIETFNKAALTKQFSERGFVRIDNFLSLDDAEQLAKYYQNELKFTNAFYTDNHNREATDEQIGALPLEEKRRLFQAIQNNAAQGVGFLYGRKKVELTDADLTAKLLKAMNSEALIKLVSEITSKPELKYADGQATKYRVGDFLTRHIDNLAGETRQIAYVVGLTKQWHPDWGGLLQFFEPSGEPTNSLAPSFNSLTLFDVNKVHSVTSVANFAPRQRFSLTGWYRK
ncbi:2OG-Fe(II) oxygenase [Thalassotalea sp. LPB0316]|uniref:2OG-Fe(II) oxygenase n=1 Tax=Thalassotalea sp. LPB0316 TaxID=2769490 RepID=UPI001867D0DD|nr:2OG-Fe(II) oxygenase family protein [Thalassotalea sp. LPB0316]QOL27159.1 2OG-Fe(II) oxygenase [Thalassotalea sp. LPB0316]